MLPGIAVEPYLALLLFEVVLLLVAWRGFSFHEVNLGLTRIELGTPIEVRTRQQKVIFAVLSSGVMFLVALPLGLLDDLRGSAPTVSQGNCPAGMVEVSAGEFTYGDPGASSDADNLSPGTIHLDAFCIDRYEVSNADYAIFVADAHHVPPAIWGVATPPPDADDLPVVDVSWTDARDYCHWANKTLPTEQQWEKAARGVDGRTYPWGDVWQDANANSARTNPSDPRLLPVDSFADVTSPYGAINLAGNAAEWVADWYRTPLPLEPALSATDAGSGRKVYRGGSYLDSPDLLSTTARSHDLRPDQAVFFLGFRCAAEPLADAVP